MKSINLIVGMIMFFHFGCNKVSTTTTNRSSTLSKNEKMMYDPQFDPLSSSVSAINTINRSQNDKATQGAGSYKETIVNGDMKYGATYSFVFSLSRTNFYFPSLANC